MQQKYRFVGTEMMIGAKKLTKFGQEIMLTAEQRKDAGTKVPLVHDSLFAKAGFTEQELSIYAYPGQRTGNSKELAAFTEKQRKVWAFVGQEPEAEKKIVEVTK